MSSDHNSSFYKSQLPRQAVIIDSLLLVLYVTLLFQWVSWSQFFVLFIHHSIIRANIVITKRY